VALAQQEQDKAQKKAVSLNYPPATEAFIDNLQAQIVLARRSWPTHPAISTTSKTWRAMTRVGPAPGPMTDAQINLNKLVGNYNWYTGQPNEIDVALIRQPEAATAAVQEAQWYARCADPVSSAPPGPN
jgi:hypothetical protein